MTDRATMQRMAAAARDRFLDVTSLEQISPRHERFKGGYPPQFSAEWWALRLRVEEIIDKQQHKRGLRFSAEAVALSDAAKGCALGDPDCEARYQAMGADGDHALPSWAMRTVREHDPARYAAVLAESRRLNALGRRHVAVDDVTRAA